jgi:predicted RNA binding protein YcfA (HicA-like mRNA interferase family)
VSKREKLRQKLNRVPPPKDFTWEEVVTLLRQYDFKESCDGGSHYMFEHSSGYRFGMSKSHPAGVLRRYQIDDAKEALDHIAKIAKND